MKPEQVLGTLLSATSVAQLATLEAGDPAISLVPFVFERAPVRLYLFVSALSPHTAALEAHDRCAILLHESAREGDPRSNHALARVSIRAKARFLTREEAVQSGVEAKYREKYPIASTLLGLGDFRFCELSSLGATLIQGFGQAFDVSGPDLDHFEHRKGR